MAALKPNSRSFFSSRSAFSPDDRQREAIEHVQGPMLVVAGAGTGKTSVLTHRIARLVHDGHAQPEEILALTYTNNAAAEMRGRVAELLAGKKVHVATFHDYCNELLRRTGNNFGVLDETDLWIYIRRRIRDLHLKYFVRAANVSQFLKDLLEFLSRCQDELVTASKYAEYVERLERREVPFPRVEKSKTAIDEAEVLERCHEIAGVFSTVEQWLRENNYGTFGHMITRAYALLHDRADLLAAERARVRFLLVDEFQDANFAQVKILAALAGGEGNVFAVGDPDQSIYHFRGASSAAFDLFQRQFPATKMVVLEKNRRSTTPILQCAFALIDKNPPVFSRNAFAKEVFSNSGFAGNGSAPNNGPSLVYQRRPLQSARDEEDAQQGRIVTRVPVSVVTSGSWKAEAPEVVATIKDLRTRLHCKWSDVGILYRLHSHRDEVLRDLLDARIPVSIENVDVLDTPIVRDLLAAITIVVSMQEDASLFQVAALPQFPIVPEELRAEMRALAQSVRGGNTVPLATVLDKVAGGPAILAAIAKAREAIGQSDARGRKAVEIIASVFELDKSSPFLQAFFQFVGKWEEKVTTKTGNMEELIEYMGYFREANGCIPLETVENLDAVRLISVHGAKGLEFPHVFILRANTGSFPWGYKETLMQFPNELRDEDSASESDDKMLHGQEERRLFYVAMTRARDTLHIHAVHGRGEKDKTPAGYMRDLLKDAGLRPWLSSRSSRGSQTPLEIFAEASPAYPPPSRTQEWLNLPVAGDLHTRLSASAVDTFQRCGLQFKLERDWKLARKPAAAMQYGAAIHRILKTYYDSVTMGRPRSDEELLALFCADIAGAGIEEEYQHELYQKQGIQQLRDFLAAVRTAPPAEVLHTEESFDIKIGDTTVVGRIDRIDRRPDGTVDVIDYKSGRARDQESADESLQLSIYAIAAEQKWNYQVHSLVFHNLEENVPVATARSGKQLQAAREVIEKTAEAIAQGIFTAKTGFHCSFCAYRNLCPAKEKRISLPTSNEGDGKSVN